MIPFDEIWSHFDPFDITDPKLLNISVYILAYFTYHNGINMTADLFILFTFALSTVHLFTFALFTFLYHCLHFVKCTFLYVCVYFQCKSKKMCCTAVQWQ